MGNMAARPVESRDELRHRIEKYLSTSDRGSDIQNLIDRLKPLGDVAIFGGMARDFARGGEKLFQSDVDMVVDVEPEKLDAFFSNIPVIRNRFGGFRLEGRYTQFDVWALQTTWAIREQHVAADNLSDLTRTTFFDWDAVVYMSRSREIHYCNNYIENIHTKIVDINLHCNPNTMGAIARTIRILIDWQGALAPNLANFLERSLEKHCSTAIENAQRKTIGRVSMEARKLHALKDQLRRRETTKRTFKFEDDASAEPKVE